MKFLLILGVVFFVFVTIFSFWAITTGIILAFWNLVLVPLFHISAIGWIQATLIGLAVWIIGGLFNRGSVIVNK